MIDIKFYISNNLDSFQINKFVDFYQIALEKDEQRVEEYSIEIIFDNEAEAKIISKIDKFSILYFDTILKSNSSSVLSLHLADKEKYIGMVEYFKKEKCSNILKSIANDDNYKVGNNTIQLEFTKNNSIIKKEVDPTYLSYLALFLKDFPKSKVKFTFIQKSFDETDRVFSLKSQLEHIKNTFKINEKQIILEGEYLEKETGNLKPIYWKTPEQSESFIPILFIDNKNVEYYFKETYVKGKDLLFDSYYNKVEQEISERISLSKNNSFISKQNLNKLSFIEIALLRLLLRKDIYELLGKKGGGRLRDVEKNARVSRNKDKIINYIKFVKELSNGLKELALNINHSTYKQGVITARIFKKEKLISVKNKQKDIIEFLKNRNDSYYINHDDDRFFLDINVIDIGKSSIREKYVDNVKKNKKHFEEIINSRININDKNKIIELIGIDFDKDIQHLQDKNDIKYEDFYVLKKEKYSLLSHQQNKFITRIGLQYFTQLYKNKFNAFIKSSSQNEGVILFTGKEENLTSVFSKVGTIYNCIVPIKIKDFEKKSQERTKDNKTSNPINTFAELSEYNPVILDNKKTEISKIDNYVILKYIKNELILNGERYNNVISLLLDIYIKYKNHTKNILIIDAKEINFNKNSNQDSSEWVRLLMSLNDIFKDIIVCNIEIDKTKNILKYRKAWSYAGFDFWLDKSRVLFYSFKKRKENRKNRPKIYKRYGATLLTGKTEKQFNYLNTNIWRHHYSFSPKDGVFEKETNVIYKIEDLGNHLFNKTHLKYFELIIQNLDSNNSPISLFEKSVQYSLNKEYNSSDKETHNRGYKISNTHFRLGSKIHISDFYYAKRLFQNSFFTTPLSFIISNFIFNTIINKGDNDYSLIGYDKYSDFLLSSTRNLLLKRIETHNQKNEKIDVKINHFTISKEGKLSREPKNLHSNIFIIVPIASTFSTSIKIEKDLKGIVDRYNAYLLRRIKTLIQKIEPKTSLLVLKDVNILKDNLLKIDKRRILIQKIEQEKGEHKTNKRIEKAKTEILSFGDNYIKKPISREYLNIILVGHRKEDNGICFDEIENIKEFDNAILDTYHWTDVDGLNKEVEVQEYSSVNGDYIQKYFIPLYTEWNKAEECTYCYPKYGDRKSERCLIETGSSSVTPQLIFSLPKTEKTKEFGNNKLNFKGSLLYGNLYKNNSKYLFYTRTGTLINKKLINKLNIIKWIKKYLKPIFKNFENEKIVIVSSASSSKSNFIDLINEHLFQYTANCVFISLEEDYIENAESLYWDALYNADTVIFVDDVLLTIKSFLEVNYIVKYIRNKYKKGKGIDFCISLINRMTLDSEQNLYLKLLPLSKDTENDDIENRLLYFSKLNNPPIEEPTNEFPLKKEQKRYKILSNISSLDAVRQEFNDSRIRLKSINLSDLNGYNQTLLDSDSISIEDDGEKYKNRKLFQLLVLDAFYSLFVVPKEYNPSSLEELENIIWDIIEKDANLLIEKGADILKEKHKEYSTEENKELIEECQEHFEIINRYKKNLKFVILKIMCNSPLIYYKDLREKSLEWILLELLKIERDITISKLNFNILKDLLHKNNNKFSKLEDLKFLLKRSVQLKSNYLIRKETFKFLEIIISLLYKNHNNLQKLYKNEYDNYYEASSKKFIYYLVSLVQELVLGHETKSIKLEQNINSFIGIDKQIINEEKSMTELNKYKKSTKNGDFLHYLRLLKLENTEIAYKFWLLIKKENTRTSKKIEDIELNSKYKNHPIYILLKKHLLLGVENGDYQHFINIKIALNNYRLDKNNNITDFFQKNILNSIRSIIDEQIISSHFIINYNDKKKDITSNDLYEFNTGERPFRILNNFDNSISKKMFNCIDAEENSTYQLSNLEIFTIDHRILYREGILSEFIEESFEYKKINDKIKSVLIIRISNFNKKNDKLYTQAVLSFFLKNEGRLGEEKLRLILLLRKSLSNFLKDEISSNTFSELLNIKRIKVYQSDLKHGLKDHLVALKGLSNKNRDLVLDDFNKYLKEKNDFAVKDISICKKKLDKKIIRNNDEIQILNNIISAQISAYDLNKEDIKPISYNVTVIKTYFSLIFSSKVIGKGLPVNIQNKFVGFDTFESIKLPPIIYTIVFPELLINMKNHSSEIDDKGLSIIYDNNSFSFINKYDNYNPSPLRRGLKMCLMICNDKLNNVELTYPLIDTNQKTFTIKLILKYVQ